MSNIEQALKAADETCDLVIGQGSINDTARVFKEQFPGKQAIIIADNTTHQIAGKKIEEIFKNNNIDFLPSYIFNEPDLYAEYSYIERLIESFKHHNAIPVAVGSGTINDLTKLSSHLSGRRYMCVATAASMDGYTAYGASITANGAKQTFSCPAPQALIADTSIISQAPGNMTASGYADLFAKVTAGADWILSHYLDVEKIEPTAWRIVQNGLHDALSEPENAAKGELQAIEKLTEGLILGGFAMQWAKSSRPASGAEHQFSHLWNMEHHTNNGQHVSHGFQVSIGMLAVTAFYEQALKTDFSCLDIDMCCKNWNDPEIADQIALEMFADTDFPTIGVTETRAKYIDRKALAKQLDLLKTRWSIIKQELATQLIPFNEVKRRLEAVGAPTEPEQIGISRQRLRDSFIRAQYIRRRFTILDLAVRTCNMENWLDALFGKNGVWEI